MIKPGSFGIDRAPESEETLLPASASREALPVDLASVEAVKGFFMSS